MRDYFKEYERWLQYQDLNPDLLAELEQINEETKEIEERFYKDLEFGTGGLRGIISAGTNRMNIYTIRKVTLGLANFILKQGPEVMNKGVVIAYDSRKYSGEFAEEAAKVLAANNIKVYLFAEIRPTPLLSFAVRYLKAYAGIVVTASHNPPEYNGYKVYNQYGGQITEELTNLIFQEIQKIDNMLEIPVIELDEAVKKQKVIMIADEIDQEYMKNVESLLLNKNLTLNAGKNLTVIYTPLHGTGNIPVRNILERVGFTNLYIVPEQEAPDPDFPTVKAPNPEEPEVFDLAIKLAKKHDADIIMATDPDADRLGVLVKIDKQYQALNGNQLGALILHYLLSEKSQKELLPENAVIVKTIVTSDLGAKIAAKYNVETENTLTGFKYIGEKIKDYKETGNKTFIFGYEESYGYLAGDFVRDKDAVQITAVVAEMALKYKQQGKSLFDVLTDIYREFGHHVEDLESITLKGIEGNNKIKEIVANFRNKRPKEINGIPVVMYEDYLVREKVNLNTGEKTLIKLPQSNVIKIFLEDGSWVAVRPSGTEPKLKFYFAAVSDSFISAAEKMENLKSAILNMAQK